MIKRSVLVLSALGAIYFIWGSTYLAIVYAIESMPPFLMLAARYIVAGAVVYAWARARGIVRPTAQEWKNSLVVGALTLGVGTGSVAWAEQWVPSGMAALLVTTVPIWMVLLEWKWKRTLVPSTGMWLGLAMGASGILMLVNPEELNLAGEGAALGAVVILLASGLFTIGAILGRDLRLPERPLMSTATQMLAGGAGLGVFALLAGEGSTLDLSAITLHSWLAWGYLVVFGSVIAYGSFVWLMKNVRPSLVSTHAYINPVVAVLLGWSLGGEAVTGAMLGAIGLLLGAVLMMAGAGYVRASPYRIARMVANRGGAIVWAFAHSMDPAAATARSLRPVRARPDRLSVPSAAIRVHSTDGTQQSGKLTRLPSDGPEYVLPQGAA